MNYPVYWRCGRWNLLLWLQVYVTSSPFRFFLHCLYPLAVSWGFEEGKFIAVAWNFELLHSGNLLSYPSKWLLTFSHPFTAFGPARCTINNGGCWSETKNGLTFSACSVQWFIPYFVLSPMIFCYSVMLFVVWPNSLLCIMQENQLKGCQCPQGFRGDGHNCEGALFFQFLQLKEHFMSVLNPSGV